MKQLQRYDLNVVATSNGEEAITGNHILDTELSYITAHLHLEWERHEPGYFSLAMFDHRMCH